MRHRQRRPEVTLESEEELEDETRTPLGTLETNEQQRAVRVALMELDEPYRAVVVLRHYEDLKFREIADVMEIPVGTVKSRMADALNRLARKLEALDQPSNEVGDISNPRPVCI